MPRLLSAALLAILAAMASLPVRAGEAPANRLSILAESRMPSPLDDTPDPYGNRIAVRVEGRANGGLENVLLFSSPRQVPLQSGTLVQNGRLNTIALSVRGDGNLFAALQDGTVNTLVAAITGTDNRLAVSQHGSRQAAHVTQRGRGNFVGITQTGW